MHLLTLPYLANFLANPNVHVVASALKLYLREQAEPLFPYTTRQALIDAMQSPTLTDQDRSMALFSAIQNMPVENRLILQRCIMMMARFREYSDLNLMDAHNLAVVFGPNFMRAPVTSTNLQVILSEGALELEIVKALVSFPDHYFPQVYERTGENWEDSKSRAYPIPHLTEQDWFVILSRARVRTYQPGAVILELGQTNTSMFRIKKGKAKVAIGQERVVVATLIDLDIFGDMSVLGNSLVSATVLADTECECWVIDADFLGTLLALEPLLGLKFFGSLARELASRIEQRTGFAPPPAAGAAADEEPSGANKKQAEAAAAATAKQQKTLNGVVPLKSFQCAVQKPGVLHVFESSLVHVTKTLGYEKKNVTQLASVIELKRTQADKKRSPEFGMELRCKTPEFKLETITYLFGSADERDQAHQLVNDLMQRSIDLANATEVDQAQGEGASFKRMVVKQPYQARADAELTLCVGDIVSVPLDSSDVADAGGGGAVRAVRRRPGGRLGRGQQRPRAPLPQVRRRHAGGGDVDAQGQPDQAAAARHAGADAAAGDAAQGVPAVPQARGRGARHDARRHSAQGVRQVRRGPARARGARHRAAARAGRRDARAADQGAQDQEDDDRRPDWRHSALARAPSATPPRSQRCAPSRTS
jgi:CRP-like cAMP-binding protein